MLSIILSTVVIALVVILIFVFNSKPSKNKNLKGKTALVTGGSNGLGQQICLKLAHQGCNVVVADIAPATETMKKLESYSIKSKAFRVDVSNYQEILKMKQDLLGEFEAIDILINNAGLIPYKTIFEQSSEEIETLTKVNFNSVIFMTKCFLEKMIENGRGHIVSISSTQGIYAFPYSLSYCATKFAVTGYMLGLKEFLRRSGLNGINTTCILPNVMATRKDITDIVDANKSVILSPENCAEIVIDAIISKKSFVTIPKHFSFVISVFNVFPFFIQHFIRDYIRREDLFFKNEKPL